MNKSSVGVFIALLLSTTAVSSQTVTSRQSVSSSGDVLLDTITLQNVGQDEQEDPTGPVEGFRATRSSSGTRINSALDELPLPIEVLTRDVIEATNATRVEDAVLATTGASVGNTFGGVTDRFLVRGFEADVAENGLLSSFRNVQVRDSANVERIEVLKGPAGALFGFGTPGGVINVITKKPLDDTFFETKTEVSSFVRVRNEFDLNAPISDIANTKARIVAAVEGTNSFRFQDAFDETFPENRFLIAPSISFEPTKDFSVLLRGQYLHDARVFDRGIPIDNNGNALSDIDAFFGDPTLDHFTVETILGDLELKYDFNDKWSLTGRAAVDQNNRDGFSVEPETVALFDILASSGTGTAIGLTQDIIEGQTILRQLEFRNQETRRIIGRADLTGSFSTYAIDHDVSLSVDRLNVVLDSQNLQSGTLTPGNIDPVSIFQTAVPTSLTTASLNSGSNTDRRINSTGLSFFDKLSYKDYVYLLAGGRVDFLDQVNVNNNTNNITTFDTTEFSPRVGIVVKPFEKKALSAFFSWGESFNPNTGISQSGDVLPPQTGRTFEGGLRYDFNDGKFGITVSAFDIRQEDEPITVNGGPFSVPVTSSSRGIEASLQGAVTDNLNVIASYTFTDSEIEDVQALPGSTTSFDPSIGEARFGVPDHILNLLVNYNFDYGKLDGLSLTGALRYSSSRLNSNSTIVNAGPFGNLALSSIELDSFVRVDVAAKYQKNENITFEFGIQNLLNEEILRPSLQSIAIPEAGINGFGSLKVRF